MKSLLILATFVLFTFNVNAQVGIGTTAPDGALDITSTTDGLLIPRVALTMTTTVLPVITGTESELVYNTATVGDVTPGFYYLSTAAGPWVKLGASAATGWSITGNSGIVGTTNYMGTDAATNADVAFRRFNLAAGKLSATSTSFGVGALSAGAASNSTAFGNNALTLNTGADNVAVGTSALAANVSGTFNTAVGKSALAANTTNANTAIGFSALLTTSTGGDNTAMGYQALRSNTGAQNTSVGVNALQQQTSGAANTAVGHSALNAAGAFSNATAFGYQALWRNTASNTTGLGFQALAANTSGTENTAVGFQAGATNTTGGGNTSLGYFALNGNNSTNNTAVGGYALGRNTGSANTAVGYQAMWGNTGGNNSTALGFHALFNNNASDNTGLGYNALQGATGAGNTAVGSSALNNLSTGTGNTAVGNQSGFAATGSNNTFLGYFAGQFSSGSNNVAIGYNALRDFSPPGASANSVAIGYQALTNNIGTSNTAIGYNAMSASSSATTSTAIGYNALGGITTGTGNVAIGYNAGSLETTNSNKLYISNSNTTATTSLIYGDFSGTRILRTNSNFQIGDPAGTGYVFPLAKGAINTVLQTSDAFGTLAWVAPSTLFTETDPQVTSTATSSVPRWNGTTLVDGVITDDGTNVGIGVAPSAGNKLDVNGKTRTTNFQMTTGAAANYILQSDATGNATWVNPTVKPYATTGAATGIYSVVLTEYTIRVFNGVSEVRLPNAVGNLGKEYIILGSNGITSKILSTSGGLIYDDVTNTFITSINSNERYTLQSDGADWIVTGR